jgi:hypothetical protein
MRPIQPAMRWKTSDRLLCFFEPFLSCCVFRTQLLEEEALMTKLRSLAKHKNCALVFARRFWESPIFH